MWIGDWGIALIAVTLVAAIGGAAGAGTSASAAERAIDFAKTNGVIRALHGGNNGPLCSGETVDVSAWHRELGLPFTRLHDSAWPYPDIVDIHAVFPNFEADPDDPRSYQFALTDAYVRAITNVGSRIVYRLGESIEHAKRKRYVVPPADAGQWARICLGVIRHYNEGWADGFRLGIEYWEIWNEPENRPAMWTGSPEQYYELYATAARAIKGRWPGLKVGGPSLGYQGTLRDGVLEPSEFMRGFLGYVGETGAPLDFFSWHGYTDDPGYFAERARAIRRHLDQADFRGTESHLNEWNYLPDHDWGPMLSQAGERRESWYARQGGAEGAAFVAAVLISLQDAPVDVANYYGADNQPFGLFSLHGAPKATFQAFRSFRALLDTPVRVAVPATDRDGVWGLAGVDAVQGKAGLLIAWTGRPKAKSRDGATAGANGTATAMATSTAGTNEEAAPVFAIAGLPWAGGTRVTLRTTDRSGVARTRTLDWPGNHGVLALDGMATAPAVVLVQFSRLNAGASSGTIPGR